MKKHFLSFLFFLIISFSFAQPAKKALFIIADGIPADEIERLEGKALKEIRSLGGYTRAHVGGERGGYSETPTISAVGYNSLLTGVWVNKHNVWDNDIAAPNYYYWNIFRLFETQSPEKTTAIFSTWLDNRTKLIGSNAKDAGNLQPDIHFDGMELDTVTYKHDTGGHFYLLIDKAVADTTAAVIKRIAPDLSWVYLEYTDEMGHRHGTSPQFDNAIMKLNEQIAIIWEAIRYRQQNFNEDWQIYITTDHGRTENGYHHGKQTDRERTTWIYTNAEGLNEHFKNENPAIVDIMPSIAKFLNISIPVDRLREIDGTPLTGKISATNLTAKLDGSSIIVSWKIIQPKGRAKVWISTSNNFKTGGVDRYVDVGKVRVSKGTTTIDVSKMTSDFYKIVIEFPENELNTWVIVHAQPKN